MKAYWIKFEDGTYKCCEGQTAYDAQMIAACLTGKKVDGADTPEYKFKADENPAIKELPYPAEPIIWQFKHPVHGVCPTFCYTPAQCAGRSSCSRDPCCTD